MKANSSCDDKDGWAGGDRGRVDQEFWSALMPMSDRLTSQQMICVALMKMAVIMIILKIMMLMINFSFSSNNGVDDDDDVELLASFWLQASGFLRGGNAINSNWLHHWTPFASQTLVMNMMVLVI